MNGVGLTVVAVIGIGLGVWFGWRGLGVVLVTALILTGFDLIGDAWEWLRRRYDL